MTDQPQNDLSAVADTDSAGTVDNPTSTVDTAATIDTPATTDAPTNTENSEEKARILKQVEFYFSDSNLPLDKFMWELTKKNDAGWVAISTVASFKRMRQFTNIPLIVEALRESPELLEVNEQGTMVRRKKPLVDKKDTQYRSIYAVSSSLLFFFFFCIVTPSPQELIRSDIESFVRIPCSRVHFIVHRKAFQTKLPSFKKKLSNFSGSLVKYVLFVLGGTITKFLRYVLHIISWRYCFVGLVFGNL